MSKKINRDKQKWHHEMSELIKSKNPNNYVLSFLVPNNDTIHNFSNIKKDEQVPAFALMFFNSLFNHVFKKHNELKDNKDRICALVEVGDWLNFLNKDMEQKIQKYAKTNRAKQ